MSLFKKFISPLLRRLWFGLAIIVVILALIISLFRALLPLADEYRDELSVWLYEKTGIHIQVASLGASWRGLGPVLVLNETVFFDGAQQGFDLSVGRIDLEVNVLKSLSQQTLVLDDIALQGIVAAYDLRVSQSSTVSTSEEDIEAFFAVFFDRLAEFSISDSLITFTTQKGHQKPLFIERLVWKNQGERHLAEGFISYLEGTPGNGISIFVDATGHWKKPQDINASVYLHADKFNLDTTLSTLAADDVVLEKGEFSFQAWAQVEQGRLVSALLDFEPSQLLWESIKGKQSVAIDAGRIEFNGEGEDWQVDSFGLKIQTNEQSWEPFSVQLFASKQELNATVTQVELANILPLLTFSKHLPKTWREYLLHAQPHGLVKHLGLSHNGQLQLNAHVQALSMQTWNEFPGLNNAELELALMDKQGQAAVTLNDSELDFADAFRAPFSFKSSQVQLHWSYEPEQLKLWSDSMVLKTEEIDFNAQFQLTTSLGAEPSPAFLSLYSEFSLPDVAKAKRLFPVQEMDEDLQAYLSQALRSGRVEKGKLLWFGPLEQFPYSEREGIFECELALREAEFRYAPDWPPFSNLNLDVSFVNDALSMFSNKLNLYGAHSDFLSASVSELGQDAVFKVKAKVEGQGSEIEKYLSDSPLPALSSTFEQLSIGGNIKGELDISIPIDERPANVKGFVQFKNNSLLIRAPEIELERLQGTLFFENDKLWTKTFEAHSFALPFSFKLQSYEDKQGQYQLAVDLNGRWAMSALQQHYPHPLLKPLSGQLIWQGRYAMSLLDDDKFNFNFNISSDLKRLNSSLPYPLSKPVKAALPFEIIYSGNQDTSKIEAQLADKVTYQSHFIHGKKKTLQQDSWLAIGAHSGDKPKFAHVISVDLPHLKLTPWIDLMNSDTGSSSERPLLEPLDIDLLQASIKNLDLYQQRFTGFKLTYKNQSDDVHIDVQSQQLLATVSIPENLESRINVNIERAELAELFSAEETKEEIQEKPEEEAKDIDFAYYKPLLSRLTVHCSQCQFMQYQLGKVDLAMIPSADGRGIESTHLSIDMGHSNLQGRLSWWNLKGKNRSHFVGDLSSKSAEELLPALGYPSPLKDTPLTGSFDIKWDKSPFEFSPKTLNGRVSMEGGEGVLVEVSDQGARILTLASLDTIWRRLRLDFNDVFQKGLFYNSIKGSYHFKDGVMTSNDLEMDAVAGTMRGQGKIDFTKENMHFNISFFPDVTSSLPVIAAFAITPVTGVAVLALSKLLEPVLEVVTELKFELEGPIDEPVLTEVERKSTKVDISNKLKDRKSRKKWESDR